MKKPSKKLQLNRESLKTLADAQVGIAAGGGTSVGPNCGGTAFGPTRAGC